MSVLKGEATARKGSKRTTAWCQQRGGHIERVIPAGLNQLTGAIRVLPNQRSREAIGGILPTEGEAILIANPLFVDCRVLPCQAPKHNAAAVVDPDRCATGIVLSDRG